MNNTNNIQFNKSVPVVGCYDIAVCGGGPAGIAAAIAAARRGARVALIERYGFLGGTATAALVNPISRFRQNGELVITGIPYEFVKRLEQLGGAITDHPSGHVPTDPEIYKLVAQRMLCESGVTLFLHSLVSDVLTDSGRITHVVTEGPGGSSAIGADYFIDCTGNADVAFKAGVPMLEMPSADDVQPASMCLRLAGVKLEADARIHPSTIGGVNVRKKLTELAAEAELPLFGGPWFCTVMNDEVGICSVNITRTQIDATDTGSVTKAEIQLREDVHTFVKLLRESIPAFANCRLIATGAQIGIRESRRIRGHHVLTAEEYISGKDFADSVARGAHQIDIHAAKDASQQLIRLDDPLHIPYSTQYADGFDNLLVAGRCISAERIPFASLRVQATAMALGESAGAAAALAHECRLPVGNIDTQRLRKILTDNGVTV